MDGYVTRRLWLDRDPQALSDWQALMQAAKLSDQEKVDYTIGIYDGARLAATGSLDGKILKCLVVCAAYQSENLLTQVVMALLERLDQEGLTNRFVYTKPKNLPYFKALGFRLLAQTEALLFMEQGFPSFQDYLSYLAQHKVDSSKNGAIVMNANPFTLGHRYLVEQALSACDHLYIFVVSEDRSYFSAQDRFKMVQAGVADLANVTVLPSRDYMVSQATFPSYFLKERADLAVAQVQAELDAQVFKEFIAPSLEIAIRFVGEEPLSPVTQVYNQALAQAFGQDLDLKIIPRLEKDGQVISATRVRAAIQAGKLADWVNLVPQSTYHYIQSQDLLGQDAQREKVE